MSTEVPHAVIEVLTPPPPPPADQVSLVDELIASMDRAFTLAVLPEVKMNALKVIVTEYVVSEHAQAGSEVDQTFIDLLISAIDAKLSAQIDEILHHPVFQRLESA